MPLVKDKKVIQEFTMEHFLRRLKLVCPRCGKKVTIQFSLEGGPIAEYEEEKKMVSVETGRASPYATDKLDPELVEKMKKLEEERKTAPIKAELPIVIIPPGGVPKEVEEAIMKAMRSAEGR